MALWFVTDFGGTIAVFLSAAPHPGWHAMQCFALLKFCLPEWAENQNKLDRALDMSKKNLVLEERDKVMVG